MKALLKGFLTGLFIKFAIGALIAGLAILGYGPNELALYFLPTVLQSTFKWTTIGVVALSALFLLRVWFNGRVLLRNSAQWLYNRSESWSVLEFVEGNYPVEKRLDYFVYFLLVNAPIYGARVPSTVIRRINEEDDRGSVYPLDGNILGTLPDKEPRYVDVGVRRRDLAKCWFKLWTMHLASKR